MTEVELETGNNALIVIGDKLAPAPHLQSLVSIVKKENCELPESEQIHYILCKDYRDVALALKEHKDRIKMMLVGPGLEGRQETVGVLLSRFTKIVLVLDSELNPLDPNPKAARIIRERLEYLGNTVVEAEEATDEFFETIVGDHVLADSPDKLDFGEMSPEERSRYIDKQLEGINRFPSLPDTQKRVAALDDMDPPRKWARAIDPDLPTRTVILRLLNSAHYGFRSRIETIEHAVALASARTIRNIVLACSVRKLFRKITEGRIEQFWLHSVATAFFAKLLALPAVASEQSLTQKSEFARFHLEDHQRECLEQAHIWRKLDVGADDPFTPGLLHDIGKIAMAMCFEDVLLLIDPYVDAEFKEAESKGELWARSSRQVERTLMKDVDHQVIGAKVAERWELAPKIRQVIGSHHLVHESSPVLMQLVALADLAANLVAPYPFKPEVHCLTRLAARLRREADGDRKNDPLAAAAAAVEESLDDWKRAFDGMETPADLWKVIDVGSFVTLAFLAAPQVMRSARGFLQLTAAKE